MSNLYKALQDLLPAPALQVATVSATHTDETCTVTMPNGGTQRVRGTGTVGRRVFVRNVLIEGTAPALTYVELEV